jgi:tRNA(fMet)-specific endonuclease VapC
MYLLDTNIISYYIRGEYNIKQKFSSLEFDDLYLSSISVSELLYGAYCHKTKSHEFSSTYFKFFNEIEILTFGFEEAIIFAKIKSKLKKIGKLVDDTDIQIASIALFNDMILVTNNVKDFQNIENLKIENWTN